MRVRCPNCSSLFNALIGERVRCPNCGFLSTTTVPHRLPKADVEPAPAPAPGPPRPAASAPVRSFSSSSSRTRTSDDVTPPKARAIFGLILNLVVPGLGTWASGRGGEGGMQLLLLVLGVLTIPFLIGLAVIAGVWAWAVIGSVQDATTRPTGPRGAFAA